MTSWEESPIIPDGVSPWKFFGVTRDRIDDVTSFNPGIGITSKFVRAYLDRGIEKGGKEIYFRRTGGKYYVAILYPE